MENVERFNLPLPPQSLMFSETAQLYATVAMWSVVAVFVVICVHQAWKTKSPLALLLLICTEESAAINLNHRTA